MSVAEAGREALPLPVPTPCVNVCRLDEATGLCLGCARNSEEIAAWAEADADFKRRVWGMLPPRRARQGMSVYRLPWTADEIGVFAEMTLRERSGSWTFGAYGASVSFAIGAGEGAEIADGRDAVTAITARGAMRLLKHEKTIAIAFGAAADPRGPEAIGLVLPRGRVSLRREARLDEAAICEAHRSQTLLPLTNADNLAAQLFVRSLDSNPWVGPTSAFALTKRAMTDGTHAVAETGLGRAEVFMADGAGDGPEFDFSLDRFAEARELPPPWTLDRVFALGALFYPRERR